jgi:hypothetical protein
MPPLATYEELDTLDPVELRFRQACQFHTLFKANQGADVDPLDTRFLWICFADAFLMTLVSLKDLVPASKQDSLKGSDLFRMIAVLRNVTVHRAVVSLNSPLLMVNRNITLHAGRSQPRHEDVVLNTIRITDALNHYEQELKNGGKWKQERRNVEGARRWNEEQKGVGVTTISLSDVFLDALKLVADKCAFTMPTALAGTVT